MTEEAFSNLLTEARNRLDITWEDPETDKKLSGFIHRGIDYLDDKAGAKLDYSQEGHHRALLFDYVRYSRADALDEFENNYLHDLLALHLKCRVKEAADNDKAKAAG